MTHGVTLALLDGHFHLTSDDGAMLSFVRDLWAPFQVEKAPADAIGILVERSGDRWRMESPGEPGGAATDPWVFAAVLRNALSRRAIADATSIVPLHGAAVERDGVFVALAAPPESGKTTLLLELLERGWRLVTDDLIPIDPRDLTARPFPKPLSVREPQRWRRFAGRWPVPGWLPEPQTVGLIPATAFECVEASPFRPDLLVFPAFSTETPPGTDPLTPAQTVAATAANLHPAGRATPERLAALARLGSGTPGYAIRYPSTEIALELFGNCLVRP